MSWRPARRSRAQSSPRIAAEDSFSFLAALTGKADDRPQREYTLHQTIKLELAIRRGEWKYLDHRGSGGNRYDQGELQKFALPEADSDTPGQLYNLKTDPGETTNLYKQHPEIVKELKELLEKQQDVGSKPALALETTHSPTEGLPSAGLGCAE